MLSHDEREKRSKYLAAVHELLAWYEAHEDMPAPCNALHIDVFAKSKEQAAWLMRYAGSSEKRNETDHIRMLKTFTAGCHFCIWIQKEWTCKKVSKGMVKIPARPAREAEPEQEIEQFEWVCEEPILSTLAL